MPESPLHKSRDPLPPPTSVTPCEVPYAELCVTSNFSFLRGASHPDELVYTAAMNGYRAIAITDRNSLAGVVRAHVAAKECGLKLVIGARLTLSDGPEVLVWCRNRIGYANLSHLLTIGKRRCEKGGFELSCAELVERGAGLMIGLILEPAHDPDPQPDVASKAPSFPRLAMAPNASLRASVPPCLRALPHLSLVIHLTHETDDRLYLQQMQALSRELKLPLLACNDVHYHDPGRRLVQDVVTCIREGCTIDHAGFRLFQSGERYLKSPQQMHRLFAACPEAVRRALWVAEQCTFSLDELRYEYPHELAPPGKTPMQFLTELAWSGAAERYPAGVPPKVRSAIEHELKLIEQLKYEAYFLTVHDLVQFARSRGILCQGRGSAANSAVCYVIGVTSVDPSKVDLLFERFVSAARNEPPDIDVDFEHERREEVIQYVYDKYGRDRAGMTATLITYRGRSVIRDVGKAMGLSLDMVDSMARRLDWWHRGVLNEQQLREAGVDASDPTIQRVIAIASEMLGFPRHLGQHTGGMVMTRGLLCELVPIENATMPNRTVIEWDKDDIDELGLLKVDVLALGMLTVIGRAFRLLEERHEGTEARRHEGASSEVSTTGSSKLPTTLSGDSDEPDQDLPRFDCMAAREGPQRADLQVVEGNAREREVRADESDAMSICVGTFQHCRGLRTGNHSGLHPVPTECPRIPCGAIDSGRDCIRGRTDSSRPADRGTPAGDGSGSAGIDPLAGTSELTDSAVGSSYAATARRAPLRACVPSSLRASSSPYHLHTIPPEDPLVYDMICDADTIGVFQIESRAQMSMLPRLRPRCFYDLVIEVAIVRPGPIQGNMVHPYLRRRCGEEAVSYPSEALRQVLSKTLGVPLFQEQAMKIAMVGAGFTAEEADQLRRAMAAWRRTDKLNLFRDKIIRGMVGNGYTPEFAEQCFNQIKGFGEYGFPESHSASFALLVYVSAWLKRHHPAVFCCAMLNSQPMGFYAPAQLVRDAREHGVEVRAIDINCSDWDCSIEEGTQARRHGGTKRQEGTKRRGVDRRSFGAGGPAMRLGFRMIKGIRQDEVERILDVRQEIGRFSSIEQVQQLSGASRATMRKLAEADAFGSLGQSRRPAVWTAMALHDDEGELVSQKARRDEGTKARSEAEHDGTADSLTGSADATSYLSSTSLPPMPLGQEVLTDYATTSLSIKAHPLSLVRQVLSAQKIHTAAQASALPNGKWVRVCGLVLVRQRPGTASGIVFVTLEDETGVANLIVRPNVFERYRPAARFASLLQCDGYIERQGQVVHVMAKRLFDRSDLLQGQLFGSRDFH